MTWSDNQTGCNQVARMDRHVCLCQTCSNNIPSCSKSPRNKLSSFCLWILKGMEGKIKALGYKSKTLSWLSYGKSHSHVGQLTELRGRLKTQAWKRATKKGQAGKPVRRWYRCHRCACCYSARPSLSNSISISITVTPASCLCHLSFGHPGLYIYITPSKGWIHVYLGFVSLFTSGRAPTKDQGNGSTSV